MKALVSLAITAQVLFCVTRANSNNDNVVPLSMMRNMGFMNAMSSPKAMVNFYVNQRRRGSTNAYAVDTTAAKGMLMIGSERITDLERTSDLSSHMTAHAGCDPYDTVVEIPNNKTNVVVYPSCIIAKRCGGCCNHPSLQCKATKTTNQLVKVFKYIYDGVSMLPDEKVDYVAVSQDTACECQCKVQASDCDSNIHDYDGWGCECKCKNDLSGSCAANKRWNQNTCSCQCANIVDCGDGYKYNMNSCVCEEDVARGGIVPSRPSDPQPDIQISEETNRCASKKCRRRYEPVYMLGTCVCQYKLKG